MPVVSLVYGAAKAIEPATSPIRPAWRNGRIYVADWGNHRIQSVLPQ